MSKNSTVSILIQVLSKRAEEAMKKFGLEGKKASDAIAKGSKEMRKSISRVDTEISKVEKSTKIFGRDFRRQIRHNERILDNFAGTLRSTSVVISGVLAGSLASATKETANFEYGMAKVDSILRATPEELKKIKKGVLGLKGVTQSPEQLAEALYDIQSAGFSGADGIKVLESSALGATAGLTQTKVIADGLTSSLNAYGAKAKEAGKYTDVMFKTVELGKIEPAQFSSNIGKVAPLASSLGVSFEELGAMIALLTQQGVSAEEAVTQIKAILSGIQSPAEGAKKEFEGLGVGFGSATLQAKGLIQILREIGKSVDGDGDKIAKLFPNSRALQGAVALLGDNQGQSMSLLLKDMETASGSAGLAYERIVSSATVKTQILFAELKKGMIFMGESFLPIFSKGVDRVTELVRSFNSLGSEGQSQIAKVTAVVAGLAGVFGALIPAVGGAVATFKLFGFKTFFKGIGLEATKASLLISRSFKKMGRGLAYIFLRSQRRIRDFLKTSGRGFQLFKAVAVSGLKKIGGSVVSFLRGFARVSASFIGFEAVIRTFFKFWEDGFSQIRASLSNFGESFSGTFGRVKELFQDVFREGSALSNLFKGLGHIAEFLAGILKEMVEGALALLLNTLTALIDLVADFGSIAVKTFTNVAEVFNRLITEGWSSAWDQIKVTFRDFTSGVAEMFSRLLTNLEVMWYEFWADMIETGNGAISYLYDLAGMTWDNGGEAMVASWRKHADRIRKENAFSGIPGQAREAVSKASRELGSIGPKGPSLAPGKASSFLDLSPERAPSSLGQSGSKSSFVKKDAKEISEAAKKVVESALSFEGKPIQPNSCAITTREIFFKAGVKVGVSKSPIDEELVRRQGEATNRATANSFAGADVGQLLDIKDAKPGDVVFFKNTTGNYLADTITHVGVIVDKLGNMIDASSSKGRVVKRSVNTFAGKIAGVVRPHAYGERSALQGIEAENEAIQTQVRLESKRQEMALKRKNLLSQMRQETVLLTDGERELQAVYKNLASKKQELEALGPSDDERQEFKRYEVFTRVRAELKVLRQEQDAMAESQSYINDLLEENLSSVSSINDRERERKALLREQLDQRKDFLENRFIQSSGGEDSASYKKLLDLQGRQTKKFDTETLDLDRVSQLQESILRLRNFYSQGSVSAEGVRGFLSSVAEQSRNLPETLALATDELRVFNQEARGTLDGDPSEFIAGELKGKAREEIFSLFDNIISKGKSVGESLKGAFKGFFSYAIKSLTKLLAHKFFGFLLKFIPGLGSLGKVAGAVAHSGGLIGRSLPSYHSGGLVGRSDFGLKPNEVVAKLEMGEVVIPKNIVSSLAGQSYETNNNYVINPYSGRTNSSLSNSSYGFSTGVA